jgi:hypothetical protein
VLDAARRTYGELSKGGKQKFGGSSSAGQFYGDYLGGKLLENQGQANATLGTNLQSINDYRNQIQTQYQTTMKQIDDQVAAAKAQAETQFNNLLLQINSMKVQSAQDKANAKLQALQGYRNQVNALQQQAYQAQLQVDTWAKQQTISLANQAQQFTQAASTAPTQYTAPSLVASVPNSTSNYSSSVSPTGYVSLNKKDQSLYPQYA